MDDLSPPPDSLHCPQCGRPLPTNAVLCVDCGFHRKLGLQLARVDDADPAPAVERSDDSNPYASPQAAETDSPHRSGRKPVFDLTEFGASQADAVAAAGEAIPLVGLFAFCLCPPVWFVLLPWSAYRLFNWYQLNARFEELRYPNSFSPHVEIALRFQAVRVKLTAAVVVSLVFCALLSLIFIARSFRP
jgi:hypothetical protein